MPSLHELITEAHTMAFERDLTKEGLKPLLAGYISQIHNKFDSAPKHVITTLYFLDDHVIRSKNFTYQDYKRERPINVLISLGVRSPLDTSHWFGEAVIGISFPEGKTRLIEKKYVLGIDRIGIIMEDGHIPEYAEANLPHILGDLQLIGEVIDAVPWTKTPAHRVSVDARG